MTLLGKTISLVLMQNRYFENPQVIPENTVPPPEMVGMITAIAVKVNPEREDSETRTVSFSNCFALTRSLYLVDEYMRE